MTRSEIANALTQSLGTPVDARSRRRVGGGSISECWRFESGRGPVFVKIARQEEAEALAAESAGLEALRRAEAVRVPKVLGSGRCAEGAFLALEWIEFGAESKASEALLGEQLAWQHRQTSARFGWDRDNTIGRTPQPNAWSDDWVGFFRHRRLGHQLDLAERNDADGDTIERGRLLCELLDAFFTSYRPVPSLLHGDLWGGNWGTDQDGLPVIYDPAVYYGDREADIAMTKLFGGFGQAFYTAYHSTWPLDAAAGTRSTLYNLYHVLNHYNLFGGGYLQQARGMIERLLAELGH
ncbi:MAG TPA: fructosamine kinase family protein [Steroidobacteraceae bacterium]